MNLRQSITPEIPKKSIPRHPLLMLALSLLLTFYGLLAVFIPIIAFNKNLDPNFFLLTRIMGCLAILNIASIIAIIRWKKWGYYGFVFGSLAFFILFVLHGQPIQRSLFSLMGVVILTISLNVGNDMKAWKQLK